MAWLGATRIKQGRELDAFGPLVLIPRRSIRSPTFHGQQ